MRLRRAVPVLLMALAVPAAASAEVSDKVLAIPQHWFIALPIAALTFAAGSFRWWLGAPLAVVPILSFAGTIELSIDPEVGAALWREQGWPYFASLWFSDFLMLGALLVGLRRGWMRRRSS